MYTCDVCGKDQFSPENLIRVWFDGVALLLCNDCTDKYMEDSTIELVIAEDESWEY